MTPESEQFGRKKTLGKTSAHSAFLVSARPMRPPHKLGWKDSLELASWTSSRRMGRRNCTGKGWRPEGCGSFRVIAKARRSEEMSPRAELGSVRLAMPGRKHHTS